MKITKTKNYNFLTSTITRVKEHNNISTDDSSYDGIIKFKMGAAIDYCENFIRSSVVPTTCTLEDESYLVPVPTIYFTIPDINVVISAITVYDYNNNPTVISSSNYRIERYSSFTKLYFNPSITYYKLVINYSTGYNSVSQIPMAVLEAVNIVTAYLFQADRQGLIPNNVVKTDLAERYLSPYVNL